MIENQTTIYREPRQPYDQYMAMERRKMRRMPAKPVDKPCIVPVSQIEGSRFDVKR